MKILKKLGITLVALIVIVVAWLAYMGVFISLKVSAQKIGPYTLVYEEYVGPYSDTGKVIKRVYDGCTQEGVVTLKGFGIYLSDPKTTDWNKARSEIGCVLEAKDLGKAKKLAKKFKVKVWPVANCLVTDFPIKNDLSYMIGPMKAYPALNQALTAKKAQLATCLELYDLPAKKILFVFKLGK